MMKIFPWMLRSIGYTLADEGTFQTPAQKKQARTFLEDLNRAQKSEELQIKELGIRHPKRIYVEMCKALHVSPYISVKFDKGMRNTGSTEEVLNTFYLLREGVSKSKVTQKRRAEQAQLEYENRQILSRDYFIRIRNSIQYQIEQVIAMKHSGYYLSPVENGATLYKSSVGEILSHIYQSIPGKFRPEFDKIIERYKTYFLDTLAGGICVRSKTIKVVECYIINDGGRLDRKVKTTQEKLNSFDYEKFDQEDVNEAFELGDGLPCYVMCMSSACRQGTFVKVGEVWKLPPIAERWLCVNNLPQEAILRYSHQPNSRPIRSDVAHRIGVEVEFETVYTRLTAVRGDNGRPLTPVKVLEVTGWAICSDSSVQGGELKSPIIGFNDADEIQAAIPREIQTFINETAKADNCGGHMNYSNARLNPFQVANLIGAWSFIFPLMYPDRVSNRFCVYQPPDDPNCHYQWMRVKPHCVEIRIFPFFWDVGSIAWRARLLELMVTSKQTIKLTQYDNTIQWNTIKQQAEKNWESFIHSDNNPIKQHLSSAIGKVQLQQKMCDVRFQESVINVLGFTEEMVKQAIRLEPVNI